MRCGFLLGFAVAIASLQASESDSILIVQTSRPKRTPRWPNAFERRALVGQVECLRQRIERDSLEDVQVDGLIARALASAPTKNEEDECLAQIRAKWSAR